MRKQTLGQPLHASVKSSGWALRISMTVVVAAIVIVIAWRQVHYDEHVVAADVASQVQQQQQPPRASAKQQTYHQWFVRVLTEHFGKPIAAAVYHPEHFNAFVEKDLPDINLNFALDNFNSTSSVLWWNKKWSSLAISKISRDADIEALFEHFSADNAKNGGDAKLELLKRVVVRALSAQIQMFHSALQLSLDTTTSLKLKVMLKHLVEDDPTMDALVLVSGWIGQHTTINDLTHAFSKVKELTGVVRTRLDRTSPKYFKPFVVAPGQSLFPLEYNIHNAPTSRGKSVHALGLTNCTGQLRMCNEEEAPLCRALCNSEYLLKAGRRSRDSAAATRQFFHRFITIEKHPSNASKDPLMALFKDTPSPGVHGIAPTRQLSCDQRINPVSPGSISDIASRCPVGKRLFQLAMAAESTDEPFAMFAASQSSTSTVSTPPPRWFDATSMLTVNLGDDEFDYISAWLRDELHGIRREYIINTLRANLSPSIDASVAPVRTSTASQLVMRRSSSTRRNKFEALRDLWLDLQLNALGFLAVGRGEKSGGSEIEQSYVHVRHFIKSELWMHGALS